MCPCGAGPFLKWIPHRHTEIGTCTKYSNKMSTLSHARIESGYSESGCTMFPPLMHSGGDAGGPLFQYDNGDVGIFDEPVLVGIMSTATTETKPSSSCTMPFAHVNIASLLSDDTVEFLPDDFTDGLALITERSPAACRRWTTMAVGARSTTTRISAQKRK